jgi:hypothetical protein
MSVRTAGPSKFRREIPNDPVQYRSVGLAAMSHGGPVEPTVNEPLK